MSDIQQMELFLETATGDPSLDPTVIKERKELLDKAIEGCEKSRRALKEQYNLTMIYHRGVEIYL